MEESSLVKAHDHAQKAATATRKSSDTTVAINEHTQAAGEFANAATRTTSIEALRTLKLLEEHHKRLAELLKLPAEPPPQPTDDDSRQEKDASGKDAAVEDKNTQGKNVTTGKPAQMPSLAQQRRFASREMSSSIASNLASARGIRSKYRGQPLSPSVSNDQAPGNLDHHARREGSRNKMHSIIDQQSGKPTWVPPTSPAKIQKEDSSKTAPPSGVEDGGYGRFYHTFGSLINKISAPLAFAGLPLIQEESGSSGRADSSEVLPTSASSSATSSAAPAKSPPSRSRGHAPSTSSDPDLSKIYSKATMRALAREGHSATDSFYVVPTSGHTMSYANILNYAEKEKRRLEASGHGSVGGSQEEEDDDFVDARETPGMPPLSPGGAKRRTGERARTERELSNTIEELHTQNKSLKDMLDKLTKRLHAFEASAQNPAMALAESYRFMRPESPLSGRGGSASTSGDESTKKRLLELEDKLATSMLLNERLDKDNRKMQKTLDKYREKWEVLKAGAKARREAQGGGGGGGGSSGGGVGDSVEDPIQS